MRLFLLYISKMKALLLVFLGGGTGSVLRYLVGKVLNSNITGIPYGTFLANILGSLLIGIILGLASKENVLSQNHTLLISNWFLWWLYYFLYLCL